MKLAILGTGLVALKLNEYLKNDGYLADIYSSRKNKKFLDYKELENNEYDVVFGCLDGEKTKEIYPKIANKYQTTSSRVERAIRHAIEISWTRGDIKLMEDLFGNSIDFDRSRPTNSEFLSTIADRFRLNARELIA